MSDGKLKYIASSMDAKLPYQLTTGVTATLEGLAINLDYAYRLLVVLGVEALTAPYNNSLDARVLPWPDAAERLRYREGEPYAFEYVSGIMCHGPRIEMEPMHESTEALHRLAAILCDDADAFRVLHWCVTHLGQEAGDE